MRGGLNKRTLSVTAPWSAPRWSDPGPAQASPGGWGAEESEPASNRTLRQSGIYGELDRPRRG
jgi:hypothetical protein